uniref:Uncharacterized protein n=1 Tax=Arundo donax TaxID=35708 RepID=A0A0A8ZG39_ARUDO
MYKSLELIYVLRNSAAMCFSTLRDLSTILSTYTSSFSIVLVAHNLILQEVPADCSE